MSNIETTKKLLRWNKENLNCDADLKKSDISCFFADKFQVKANGRVYDANYDNYFEFLNDFRANIKSLDHDIHEFIDAGDYVILASSAQVTRTDNSVDNFETALILKFDHAGKIVLWYETYAVKESV